MREYLRNLHKGMASRSGMAMISVFLVVIVLTLFLGSLLRRSIGESRNTQRRLDILQAEYLAESGIDKVKQDLYKAFEVFYAAQGRTADTFTWFDDLVTDPLEKYSAIPTNAKLKNTPNAAYSVRITDVDVSTSVPKDITLVSTGTFNGITKTATAVVRYSMGSARVFDYSYFINNYGWFYGSSITSQGDVRSNGNFSFMYNPLVNGDAYGSVTPELGAVGTVGGSYGNESIGTYRRKADDTARPANPTADPIDIDGDFIPEEFPYENGYDGTVEKFPSQESLNMPYLGNLQYYKELAANKNGTIRQKGVTLVNNVLEDNIVLIGTDAAPIQIDGPVVVTGDVLIKGKVTGQGTIYSGRNTHVIGSVEYVNPPAWLKPDINPSRTDASNENSDFLGLVAKGNIVIGNYTERSWDYCKLYLNPRFTKAYKVDVEDADIGYVSYYSEGEPYFNGDYTGFDGGKKTDGSKRRFYESSYDNKYFASVADSYVKINQVDAVTYTNHAFTGRVNKFTMNGSIISRDEAIIYSNYIKMNYDVRARDKGEELYLPRTLELPHIQYIKLD